MWRVRACCRQDDGLCLKFSLKVQDFHPSKPHVEVFITAEGSLLTGPEGEARHTFTAADHMKSMKNIQRYSISQHPSGPNGREYFPLNSSKTVMICSVSITFFLSLLVSDLAPENQESALLEQENIIQNASENEPVSFKSVTQLIFQKTHDIFISFGKVLPSALYLC